jgi:retinol dehydrogenase-12
MNQTYSRDNMAGKVCLVTGATAGIGKVTASALASQGADLIITGRNQQKTEDTVQEIRTETGNGSVQYLLADFSDLQQVRQLGESFKERYSRLDVLVNNAGAFFNSRVETSYGVEMTFLINHLALFLLTNQLLEIIKDSAPARIVNVSSEGHRQDKMDFEDLGFKQGYFGMRAYGRSKLANILFTYELARRLENTRVTVNALHPGHVATDIWKTSFPLIGPALKWIIGLIALSPEQGAENSIYLAASPEVEGVTGKYFVKREPAQSSPISYDENVAKKLWEVSESLFA